MNTPRTRPPKRYVASHAIPEAGTYIGGIHDTAISRHFIDIVTRWTHLEESAISLFGELIGISDHNAARIVFRTIRANDARLKIMEAMLEKSPTNVNKPAQFEELLSEFRLLTTIRNKYVHGKWFSSEKGVFIEVELDTYYGFEKQRRVTVQELQQILSRMAKLQIALVERRRQWMLAQALVNTSKSTKS